MVDAWTIIISIVIAAAIIGIVAIAWGNEIKKIVPRKINLPSNKGEKAE